MSTTKEDFRISMTMKQYNELIARRDKAETQVKVYEAQDRSMDRVDVAIIGLYLGIAKSTVYSQPWLMPNHGPKFKDGPAVWTNAEWKAWNERPVDERKAEYYRLMENLDGSPSIQ
jgi:hypothetical protein